MNLSEITNSLKNNKLRTFLTGFSIAWGIILLTVMLGAGDGVEKGIRNTMSSLGADQIQLTVSLGSTDTPYAGYAQGRDIHLNRSQLQYLRDKNKELTYAIEPSYKSSGTLQTDFGTSSVELVAMSQTEQDFSKQRLVQGRRFSPRELSMGERVAILTEGDISKLFQTNQNPLGQNVIMNGITYRVVGVVETKNPFVGTIYIPYETYAGINPNKVIHINDIIIFPRTTSSKSMKAVQKKIETEIRTMLKVAPNDKWAVQVKSSADMEQGMNTMFTGLQVLLWIMGIGSLSIGTIGVSNIMSVTVQERMREFGIRKSIGAKPRDILQLVLGESLILSISSGSIGLILGYGIIKLLDYLIAVNHWAEKTFPMGPSGKFATFTVFENPNVNIGVTVGALVILILAGLIAGFSPARKAIRIPAITAMRDTK